MDVSQFQVLIQEYEGLVGDLTNELQKVKSEHEELKTKIPTVVNENQILIEELKRYVTNKKSKESETDHELIQNLQKQIDLVTSEKEYVVQLWRRATKSLEILENELNAYKSGSAELFPKNEYVKIKRQYEEKILALEHQLQVKSSEINSLLENVSTKALAVQQSESQINILNRKISELEESGENLRKKCRDKDQIIEKLMDQNREFRIKMVEALEVVHAALNEKDAALLREAKIRTEIETMNKDLDCIVKGIRDESDKNILAVKDEAEKRYAELLERHRKLQNEFDDKLAEAEQYRTKNTILQNEIGKFSSGVGEASDGATSKLLILEKNLEATFQKLLVSEKLNIQLKSDIETMKNDMEQMAAYYERILKAKDVERLSLQNIINQLQSAINEKDLALSTASNEIERHRNQINTLEKTYKQHVENQDKVINEIRNEKDEVTGTLAKEMKDLGCEIDSRDKVNKKVIEETKNIISKLESLAKALKIEIHRLKKENKLLKNESDVYIQKLYYYKNILNVLAGDVNKINTTYRCAHQQTPNVIN